MSLWNGKEEEDKEGYQVNQENPTTGIQQLKYHSSIQSTDKIFLAFGCDVCCSLLWALCVRVRARVCVTDCMKNITNGCHFKCNLLGWLAIFFILHLWNCVHHKKYYNSKHTLKLLHIHTHTRTHSSVHTHAHTYPLQTENFSDE